MKVSIQFALLAAAVLSACTNPIHRATSDNYAEPCAGAKGNRRLEVAEQACYRALVNVDMGKLSHQSGGAWIGHSHPATFKAETTSGGNERLVAGVPAGDLTTFERLAESVDPPYLLLYVLHTSRGEGKPGRYQSTPLNVGELHSFLERFSAFLIGDARFDIGVHSPSENATVIWDRHSLVHAYGPTERFVSVLTALGFEPGEPNASFPHRHHYRAEFDVDAADILKTFAWRYSPLQPEDEQ